MKIKVCTQVKPVFIQEGTFVDRNTNKNVTFYSAVCVCGVECDKISVKSECVSELGNYIGSDVYVWLEVDTNNNSKPRIIEIGDKSKK